MKKIDQSKTALLADKNNEKIIQVAEASSVSFFLNLRDRLRGESDEAILRTTMCTIYGMWIIATYESTDCPKQRKDILSSIIREFPDKEIDAFYGRAKQVLTALNG
jgi:hypothetical protein